MEKTAPTSSGRTLVTTPALPTAPIKRCGAAVSIRADKWIFLGLAGGIPLIFDSGWADEANP